MFDREFRDADDAAVVAAISDCHAAEAAAGARKLAAIAELTRRRCADGEHAHWACDDWDAAAAEVSAILGVSHGRASRQMDLAMSIIDLPAIAALFRHRRISPQPADRCGRSWSSSSTSTPIRTG